MARLELERRAEGGVAERDDVDAHVVARADATRFGEQRRDAGVAGSVGVPALRHRERELGDGDAGGGGLQRHGGGGEEGPVDLRLLLRFEEWCLGRKLVGGGNCGVRRSVAVDERAEGVAECRGAHAELAHLGVDRGVLLLADGESGDHLRQRGRQRAGVRGHTAATGRGAGRRHRRHEPAQRFAAGHG